MRSHEAHRALVLRLLLPIAAGHLASAAVVVFAVFSGASLNRDLLQALALGLLIAAAVVRSRGRRSAGAVGLAAGSFVVCSAHGVGLALVPVLMPLCLSAAPVSDFISWTR